MKTDRNHPTKSVFERLLDPFAELRTIPTKWDLSALRSPARPPKKKMPDSQSSRPDQEGEAR